MTAVGPHVQGPIYYLRRGGYVMPGVCLFVCLSVNNFTSKLLNGSSWKFYHTDVSVDREKLIKFWKSSVSESESRNFSKDSSTLRDMAFISLDNLIGSLWKFYRKCNSAQGTRCWILEVIRIALAEVCALLVLLFPCHHAGTICQPRTEKLHELPEDNHKQRIIHDHIQLTAPGPLRMRAHKIERWTISSANFTR